MSGSRTIGEAAKAIGREGKILNNNQKGKKIFLKKGKEGESEMRMSRVCHLDQVECTAGLYDTR